MRVLLVPLCLLAVSGRVSAQCAPAQYDLFGQGCPGSGVGGEPCLSSNWGQSFAGSTGNRTYFAILARSSQQPMLICGVRFRCRTADSSIKTTNVLIYDRPTGAEPGQSLGATTMRVGASIGYYGAEFAPPVIIRANTEFFIVIDDNGLLLPLTLNGTSVPYYHSGPSSWLGPFNHRWNFQIDCCNFTPLLGNQGIPRMGGSFRVHVNRAARSSVAMLFTGFSNSFWGSIPLPLDLTPFGAPGCSLLAPGFLIQGLGTDATGAASQGLAIPADQTLCGSRIYQQWVILDTHANVLGFAFSNGGVGTIGA